jgi:hypothetical protein
MRISQPDCCGPGTAPFLSAVVVASEAKADVLQGSFHVVGCVWWSTKSGRPLMYAALPLPPEAKRSLACTAGVGCSRRWDPRMIALRTLSSRWYMATLVRIRHDPICLLLQGTRDQRLVSSTLHFSKPFYSCKRPRPTAFCFSY